MVEIICSGFGGQGVLVAGMIPLPMPAWKRENM